MSIPSRIGQVVTFTSHGNTFHVKKHKPGVFSLNQESVTTRNRWGTADEIRQDIAHCELTGNLPCASSRW